MIERLAEASPQFKARIAGVFYLLTILTGAFALVVVSGRLAANLIATACYIAVTLLFYDMFRFLPRILGALMAFGGVGWVTFLSPPLANHLSPYNMVPGILGEGSLTFWLLVNGVN